MFNMRWMILLIFIIGIVSAVEIDFDCPDEIIEDEIFECELEVDSGDGFYDVKVELDKKRSSVLKIWDIDEGWKSGYYYLKEFIEDGGKENIKMKVSKKGDYNGFLKLRQGDKRNFFEIEMEVLKKEKVRVKAQEVVASEVVVGENLTFIKKSVITLNDAPTEEVEELIYVSSDYKVLSYLPYVFAVFLIAIIGILLWERKAVDDDEDVERF